jgi:hypothetical protein
MFESGYCKVDDCGRPIENRTTRLCATHSKALRQIVKDSISKQGEKRKKEQPIYEERSKAFLRKNPRCRVYPKLRSEEVHHMKGRAGSLYLDERYWMAVSAKAHAEITNNPTWARAKGYIITRSAA